MEHGNVGYIHPACADERAKQFQQQHPKLSLKALTHVKIRFDEDGHTEWMWVKITSFNDDTREFEGTVDNDPFVLDNVKYQDKVKGSYDVIVATG